MYFDDVYRNHYNELRRFGRQLSLSSESCEDILQETFLKFYLELKRNVEFNNPRAWLYKVFLNHFKTRKEAENRRTGKDGQLNPSDLQSGNVSDEYVRNEQRQIVIKMLGRMESRDRELLMLYHNGFTYSEMAEILGINPASVGKTLVRAIEKLKGSLKIHYHEMFDQN